MMDYEGRCSMILVKNHQDSYEIITYSSSLLIEKWIGYFIIKDEKDIKRDTVNVYLVKNIFFAR